MIVLLLHKMQSAVSSDNIYLGQYFLCKSLLNQIALPLWTYNLTGNKGLRKRMEMNSYLKS